MKPDCIARRNRYVATAVILIGLLYCSKHNDDYLHPKAHSWTKHQEPVSPASNPKDEVSGIIPTTQSTVIVYVLDTKTEIPETESNRTDKRYFHGWRILREIRLRDERFRDAIVQDITSLTRSGTVKIVAQRDGDYGIRYLSIVGKPTDALLCSYCRPCVLQFPNSGLALEADRKLAENLLSTLNRIVAAPN